MQHNLKNRNHLQELISTSSEDLITNSYNFLEKHSILLPDEKIRIIESLTIFLIKNSLIKERDLSSHLKSSIESEFYNFLSIVREVLGDQNLNFDFLRKFCLELFFILNNDQTIKYFKKFENSKTFHSILNSSQLYINAPFGKIQTFKMPTKSTLEKIIKCPFFPVAYKIDLIVNYKINKKGILSFLHNDYKEYVQKKSHKDLFIKARNRAIIALYINLFLRTETDSQETTIPKIKNDEIKIFPIREKDLITFIQECFEILGDNLGQDIIKNQIKIAFQN